MGKCIILCFIIPVSLWAQTEQKATHEYWGTLVFQQYLRDSSMVFLDNNYRLSNEEIGFYRYHVYGGFEFAANQHWRPGISLKYADFMSSHDIYTNPYIQHVGFIGGVRFVKELSYEWIAKSKSDNPNIVVRDESRWALRGKLEKDWRISDHLIRVGVFYRLFIISRIGEDKQLNNSYPRTIDKTRLQIFAEGELIKGLFVKAYYMKETDYFNQFDTSLNIIKNILGIDLKYVLY